MKKLSIAATLLLFLLNLTPLMAQAEHGLAFSCDFLERLDSQEWQVVDSRSYVAPVGRSFQFSMGSISCDFNSELITDTSVNLQVRVSSFDVPQRNYFDRHLVTMGASIFYDSVVVREESSYRVRLTVDSLVPWLPECSYMFVGGDFHSDPSGDFEFYFVPNTLGDYRWNQIRDAFEQNLDYIRARVNFKDPTRVNFYISPCRVNDVGWDLRWGNALDYGRNALFAHYTHGVNALHPETLFMLKLIRHWGYAPALLFEGTSSILELCDAFAQDYLRTGELPELATLGRSADFRAQPRNLSAYAAGSFVDYLINTRGLPKLQSYYQRASDLTLTESFAAVYDETFASVEAEWRNYLDTMTVAAGALVFFRDRSQDLMKLDESLDFQKRLLDLTGDTLRLGPVLSNLLYTFGDYERAAEIYRAVAENDSADALADSYYANLLLILGKVDEAEALYRQTAQVDTISYLPEWKLGLIAQAREDYQESIDLMLHARRKTPSIPIRVDLNIAIGDSYRSLGLEDSAGLYFQMALDTAKWLLGTYESRPLFHLRVGRAALRLGEGELALENLQAEFFLEERMYYLGQILVALGQAYDVLGKREEALEEYRQVFAHPSGWLERKQAEAFINDPYFYR
ncbi:MAG: tetratricopeptide repeat protein [bacterium]